MKVVIDIPEEDYKDLMNEEWISALNDYQLMIRNGIVLPKGHGDLIDRDVALADFHDRCIYEGKLLKYIPTVIPADKWGRLIWKKI